MKAQNIETIKKRYKRNREWLLIRVLKMDEATTTPLTGKLLAHSPHRYEIYQKLLRIKKPKNVLVECASDELPEGYAAAF
ncbi:MAG: hypothetical protein HY584_00725 [Candidatus Omnitrophica bacterium]|nr:hypothetical protein [Candidatus Omnitrophota bacterium]